MIALDDMRDKLSKIHADYMTNTKDSIVKYSALIAEIKYTDMQNILLSYDKFNGKDVIIQGAIVNITLEDDFIGVALRSVAYKYADVAIACKFERTSENIDALKNKIVEDSLALKGTIVVTNNGSYINNCKIVELKA